MSATFESISSRHNRRMHATVSAERASLMMDRICDLCLWVAVLLVPFTMAGIQAEGIAMFVGCSLIMGLVWSMRQLVHPTAGSPFSGAEFIAVAAIGLVGLQLVPLPPGVLRTLAPFSSEYLALWGDPNGRILGDMAWPTISLTPSRTQSGMVLLIGYAVFFLTLVRHLKTSQDVDQAIRLVAVVVSAMAFIGLAQLFVGNGQFLWMFDHPHRSASWPAKGAFTNQNHFAHFLALGIGPLIWWWQSGGALLRKRRDGMRRTRRREFGSRCAKSQNQRQWLIGIAIALVAFAAVLSFSRGGVAAFILALLVSVTCLAGQWNRIAQLVVPVLVFVLIGMAAFGTDDFEHEWNTITGAGSLEELSSGRFHLWAALVEAIPSFWQTGSGLGSHAEVYPIWMSQQFDVRFSHAESGYLQMLLELGVPGFILLMAGIGLCARWCWGVFRDGDADEKRRITVLAAGLIVSVLHSICDFVWYVPGTMILTLVIAACVCRCFQLRRELKPCNGNPRNATGFACVMIVSTILTTPLAASVAIDDAAAEQEWMNYRRHAITAGDECSYDSLASLDDRLDVLIHHLENCVRIDSSDFRAVSALSALYLRRFERNQQHSDNRMTVREIRNTVRSVGFQSPRETREWLKRAFGKNTADLYRALVTARSAVQGQPLRGETYLVLAQVGFLAGLSAENESALIDQAVRLRPHSAPVLYLAGLDLVEDGDMDEACKLWREACAVDRGIRPLIVRSLAAHYPATEVIERLAPGADGLWLLFREYSAREESDQQTAVAAVYRGRFNEFLSTPSETPSLFWDRSYEVYAFLGNDRKALACLQLAVRRQPENFSLRRRLGMRLLETQQFQESRRHLEWCRLRNPDDRVTAEALERIEAATTLGG